MADRPPDDVLAQHLLKAGILTEEQLASARRAQVDTATRGRPSGLGDILVQQGVLPEALRENIERKLEAQREEAKHLGTYRILKKLGEGGMGAVYLAEDPTTRRKVALKVLPKVAAREEDAVLRFLREVDSARKLDHPNIVRAGASGEDKGFHYYVMEYVEGDTLGGRLKREEALAPDEATKVVLQIAQGLKFAHGEGFIHRDIKPDNVVVSKEGVAKIMDMGLSKNIDEAQTFRTVTGVALGTPHYISPEQARGDKGIDGRADIYSLGATYYHLVTGETPFHGANAMEVIAQHINKQLPDPRDIRDGIPDGVAHVIRNMMAKKPKDRYRDCAELVSDLELLIAGKNPSSQPLDSAHSTVALPMAREARELYRAQRRGQRPATYRATTRPKSTLAPLKIGGVVAVVVLVLVFALAMGGGSTSAPSPAVVNKNADPKPHALDRPIASPKTPEELHPPEARSGRFAEDEMRRRSVLDLGGGVRMELVSIKPGTFTMGGKEAPVIAWQMDERPEHQVTITKGYWLAKYEVTRGQFAAFVKETGFKTEAERDGKAWGRSATGLWQEIAGNSWRTPAAFTQTDDHPVTCVSWSDANAFCDWVTKKTGRTVRLPTEAEWEYACRAGSTSRWSFGDDKGGMGEYGWDSKNSGGSTHPVGQKKPNAWGLYDMHGNVWEWCQDWGAAYPGDAVDPSGPTSGNRRIMRGGAWQFDDLYLRSAFRNRSPASSTSTTSGFRVAVP